MSVSAQDMVVLGRVVAPYGLQGWVKLHFFGDDGEALGSMPQWWLGAEVNGQPGQQWTPYTLQELKPHGKGLIARFVQVGDRNASEAIDGFYIAAPRAALPKTAKNEYYWAELIGLAVVNTQGERLGEVANLVSSGAHDVLCVQGGEGTKERLLPFVAQVVKNVDPLKREILVEWGLDW